MVALNVRGVGSLRHDHVGVLGSRSVSTSHDDDSVQRSAYRIEHSWSHVEVRGRGGLKGRRVRIVDVVGNVNGAVPSYRRWGKTSLLPEEVRVGDDRMLGD